MSSATGRRTASTAASDSGAPKATTARRDPSRSASLPAAATANTAASTSRQARISASTMPSPIPGAGAGTTARRARAARSPQSCAARGWRPRSAACASAPPGGRACPASSPSLASVEASASGASSTLPATLPGCARRMSAETRCCSARPRPSWVRRARVSAGSPSRRTASWKATTWRSETVTSGVPARWSAAAADLRRPGTGRMAFAALAANRPEARACVTAALALRARIAPSDRACATAQASTSAQARASADTSLSSSRAAAASSPGPGAIGLSAVLRARTRRR